MAETKHAVDEIIAASRQPTDSGVTTLVDGRWVVAKPVHYDPLPWKLRRWWQRVRALVGVRADAPEKR